MAYTLVPEQDKTLRQKNLEYKESTYPMLGKDFIRYIELADGGEKHAASTGLQRRTTARWQNTSKVKRQWAREKFGNSDKKDDTTQTAEKADKQEEEKEPGFSKAARKAKDYVKIFQKSQTQFSREAAKNVKNRSTNQVRNCIRTQQTPASSTAAIRRRTNTSVQSGFRKEKNRDHGRVRKLKELSDLNKQAQERRNRQAEKRQNE